MIKNYLTTHNLQYPYDAKALIYGGRYAWQVQKIANGIVTNKTEAWEFVIRNSPLQVENKYTPLKKVLDAGYYTASNNKIFFKFNEEYASDKISIKIYDSKRELVKPKAKNEDVKKSDFNYKQNGYNRYEINLDELNVEKGFYILETKNGRGEVFLLKFYVQ
jgi:hypothetical protein